MLALLAKIAHYLHLMAVFLGYSGDVALTGDEDESREDMDRDREGIAIVRIWYTTQCKLCNAIDFL